jgi:two-component system response regulator FixJ
MSKCISIVDDDVAVRDALAILMAANGYEIGAHASAKDFLASPYLWGCVISDLRMPDMSGLDLLQAMKTRNDVRPVILLTGYGDIDLAIQAIRGGAFEFIEKPFNNVELLELVERAAAQDEQLTELRNRYESLTERQRETMSLMATGMPTKEIARTLDLSPRTVEIHRAFVMSKMNAGSLAELVKQSMRLGRD